MPLSWDERGRERSERGYARGGGRGTNHHSSSSKIIATTLQKTLDNTTTHVIKQQAGDYPTAIETPPTKTKHRRVETGPRNLSGRSKKHNRIMQSGRGAGSTEPPTHGSPTVTRQKP